MDAEFKIPGQSDHAKVSPDLITGATLLALRSSAKDLEYGWVKRRVEKLEFLDTRAIRWRVSIDFMVPELAPPCPAGPSGYRLVPLTVFPKEDLAAFDLRDEKGNAMWLPTAAELSPLLAPALIEMARRVLGEETSLPDDVAEMISVIVAEVPGNHKDSWEPFKAAAEKIDTAAQSEEIKAMRNRLAKMGVRGYGSLRWIVAERKVARSARKASQRWRDVPDAIKKSVFSLMCNKYFRSQLQELAYNYVAFAGIDSPPGTRRVIKFCWERSITFRWDRSVWRRILQSAGLRCWPAVVPVGDNGGSYNFEVTAPAGVDVTRITVKSEDPDASGVYTDFKRTGFSPHVSIRVPPVGASRYEATAYLRICPAGWMFATLAVTTVIAVAMVAGWRDLGAFYSHADHTATREADTAATLLAAVLAVIASWLVRPGEHPLASRLLLLVRILLGLDALVALVGTGYLVLRGSGGPPDSQLWGWLAVIAIAIVVPVFVSWLIPAISSTWRKSRFFTGTE